jgi:subtilase family serine protease
VAVYDSTPYFGYVGWLVFGGTSVASPVCAGIANAGGSKRGSGELSFIYSNTSGFHDVTTGGTSHYKCTTGWDFVTGWGSPVSTTSL